MVIFVVLINIFNEIFYLCLEFNDTVYVCMYLYFVCMLFNPNATRVCFMQKGFPLDSTLDSLMAFFEKFGATELVQMRRNKKREFKVNSFAFCAVSKCLVSMHSLCHCRGSQTIQQ